MASIKHLKFLVQVILLISILIMIWTIKEQRVRFLTLDKLKTDSPAQMSLKETRGLDQRNLAAIQEKSGRNKIEVEITKHFSSEGFHDVMLEDEPGLPSLDSKNDSNDNIDDINENLSTKNQHKSSKFSQKINDSVSRFNNFTLYVQKQFLTLNISKYAEKQETFPITRDGARFLLDKMALRSSNKLFLDDQDIPISTPELTPRNKTVTRLVRKYVIIPPADFCGESESDSPFLLALQLSLTNRVDMRTAVRKTWGSVVANRTWVDGTPINAKVKILFVLANKRVNPNKPNPRLPVLKEEANIFKDLLYVDMRDSYNNLTLKVLSGLDWIRNHCQNVKFVLKVDDDTFVNMPVLIDLLLYRQDINGVMGYRFNKGPAMRSGRWKVRRKTYGPSFYPDYVSGCSYLLSFDALSSILEVAPYFPMLPSEDVFITGLLRAYRNIKVYYGSMFTFYDEKWPDCSLVRGIRLTGTRCNLKRHVGLWYQLRHRTCIERYDADL